jgi:predicted ester cyclase
MSETNKAVVRRLVDQAQSNSNFRVVDELLAADFVDHTPFPGVPPTRDGVKMLFGGLRAAFPDLHVTIDEQIAEGEKVMTRKTFRGTHRGEFMGAPPTNRPVSWEVIDILTLCDGRIVEHRMITDRASLQQQLAG